MIHLQKHLLIVIIASTFIGLSFSGCIESSNHSSTGKAEGVKSLLVYFQNDSDKLNATTALQNLTGQGYVATTSENYNGSNWSVRVNWPIPDSNYSQKFYLNDFTVIIYGFSPTNGSLPKSYIIVIIEPLTLADESKKNWDKNLTKQAAYEIANVVGISLDWDRHNYGISWMTMTSEGHYDEK